MTIKGKEDSSSAFVTSNPVVYNFEIEKATYSPIITADDSVVYWEDKFATLNGIQGNGAIEWTVDSGSATLTDVNSQVVKYRSTKADTLTLRATVAESANYKEATATKIINVEKVSGSEFVIDSFNSSVYTGSPITPTSEVMYKNVKLDKNTDFKFSYSNNTNAGNNTAVLTVTGEGNYSGEKSINFTIAQEKKTVITNILDRIEELLKDKDISIGEREELMSQQKQLIDELVGLLTEGQPVNQEDIQKDLDYINKLLMRDDLTDEQRQLLTDQARKLTGLLDEQGKI